MYSYVTAVIEICHVLPWMPRSSVSCFQKLILSWNIKSTKLYAVTKVCCLAFFSRVFVKMCGQRAAAVYCDFIQRLVLEIRNVVGCRDFRQPPESCALFDWQKRVASRLWGASYVTKILGTIYTSSLRTRDSKRRSNPISIHRKLQHVRRKESLQKKTSILCQGPQPPKTCNSVEHHPAIWVHLASHEHVPLEIGRTEIILHLYPGKLHDLFRRACWRGLPWLCWDLDTCIEVIEYCCFDQVSWNFIYWFSMSDVHLTSSEAALCL